MKIPLTIALLLLAGCTQNLPEPTEENWSPTPEPTWNTWWGDIVVPTASTEVSGGAEPSILESKDGRYLWIGDTSGLYISEDHGETWAEGADPFPLTADGYDLAEDDNGVLYFSTTTAASLTIASSSDGGYTTDYSSQIVDVAPVADRPWLAARGDGELVLFMYDFGRTTSETCVRSTDGGETWPDRGLLSQAPQGGGALFDEDGNAYVGLDEGTIVSYGTSCLMSTADLETTEYEMFPHDVNSHMLNPAYENRTLYMAGQSANQWHGLFVSALNLDSGERHVHEITGPATTTVMFPRIDVRDGRVAAAWYGSEDPGNPTTFGFSGSFNVYLAIVDGLADGTPTSQVVRLTDVPNHVGDICVGGVGCSSPNDRDLLDYFGLNIGREGRVHVAYGDDREGSQRRVSYGQISLQDVPPLEIEEVPGQESETSGNNAAEKGEDFVDEDPLPVVSLHFENGTLYGDASESYDPDGGDVTVQWIWGDGAEDEGPVQSHAYEPGEYNMNVIVRDDEGNRQLQSTAVTYTKEAVAQIETIEAPESQETPGISVGLLLGAIAIRRVFSSPPSP